MGYQKGKSPGEDGCRGGGGIDCGENKSSVSLIRLEWYRPRVADRTKKKNLRIDSLMNGGRKIVCRPNGIKNAMTESIAKGGNVKKPHPTDNAYGGGRHHEL